MGNVVSFRLRKTRKHGHAKVIQLCTTVRKFNSETKEDLGKCTPEHDQTIYQGILSAQIKLVKGFSLTTSFISIACQPVLLMNMHQANTNLAVMAGAGAFLSIFTFATPLLIHHISKKYVTALNYNKMEDSYTAITYSLFLRKKEIKFKIKDVHVPSIPGMFTTFQAKDVPLFVDADQFEDPRHYGKIMGYDKPIDFRWNNETNTTSS